MADLARLAREDAERARLERQERERTRQPTDVERLTAYEIGRILGIEVDPRSVREGDEGPYKIGEVEVFGVAFTVRFMRDTNGLHPISCPVTARRLGWRGLFAPLRSVRRIGDLDGWLPEGGEGYDA